MLDLTGRVARRTPLVSLCVLGLVLVSHAAWADYKLRPGDSINLTIIGIPELTTKAVVDQDGKVNLPLAGDVAIAGSSIAEAKAKLQAILPLTQLTRRLDDGRQVPVIISPSQVSVSIAEYRPIYVDGDVTKPGEVVYRPGLSVRQAIALAGGLGLSRGHSGADSLTQIVDLTGQHNELSIVFARTQVQAARLQAELDGATTIDPQRVAGLPVAPKVRDQIVAAEQQVLDARNRDFDKERAYLQAASQREVQRANILSQQGAKDNEGVSIDTADLQRLEELFKKGAVALPTISEARRTVLSSSTRALQTTAALGAVEKDQGELSRRLERLGDTRRIDLLKEMGEVTTKLVSTRAQLQAVTTKLRYAGMLKPQLSQGLTDQVKVAIMRNTDGTPTPIDAQPDTELQPGDALEVAVQDATETVEPPPPTQ